MAPDQPDLETVRLVMRRPGADDAPAVFRILSDDKVLAHNPSDRLNSLAGAERLVERWLEHWTVHGFGNACVIERVSGELIGNCGVRWMELRGRPALNLMYRFLPSTWGQGLATEAAGTVLDWAEHNCPEAVVVARIRPDNLASQAVACKIGLRRDDQLDDLGPDGLDWAFTNRSI